jgi:arabinan endo-1,5-alpha-L-arabinosidase
LPRYLDDDEKELPGNDGFWSFMEQRKFLLHGRSARRVAIVMRAALPSSPLLIPSYVYWGDHWHGNQDTTASPPAQQVSMRCVPISSAVLLAVGLASLGCGGPSAGTPTLDEAGSTTPPDASSSMADATTPVADVAATGDAARAEAGPVDASRAGADAQPDARAVDAGTRDTGATETGAAPAVDGSAGCGNAVLGGGPITTTATHLDIGVHDPSMIWDGAQYYLFATGGSLGNGSTPLGFKSSADMLTWGRATQIVTTDPAFVTSALGTTPATLWAADISDFNGLFHVYYAGSIFQTNNSVIGLVTTPSLQAPQWTDRGLVIQSRPNVDDFNAIDPNLSFDQSCTPWLAFGSFWDGIKLRQVDPATGLLSTTNTTTYSLASRNGGAIEAASIISHNGFYYLFVSYGICCQGVNSTYRTMVGRAPSITGPYTDKAGANMLTGAADQLLATSGRYIGPGGGTAWKNGNTYLYAYHYYDGDANGASKLQIRPVTFDATDRVVLGDPLFP